MSFFGKVMIRTVIVLLVLWLSATIVSSFSNRKEKLAEEKVIAKQYVVIREEKVAFRVVCSEDFRALTNLGQVSNEPLFVLGYEFIGEDEKIAYRTQGGEILFTTQRNVWKGETNMPPAFWMVVDL